MKFYQLFWGKAADSIEAEAMNIVCRLKAFNHFLSFLWSIGNIMECPRIAELFQVTYGSDIIIHMLLKNLYAR